MNYLSLLSKSLTRNIPNRTLQSFSGCNKNNNNNKANKPPVDPTMAEFFGRKPTIEEIQKLLSPAGFLNEIQYKDYDGVSPQGQFEQLQPAKKEKVVESAAESSSTKVKLTKEEYLKKNLNEWGMPEEVGFKVKGPEPTRFGDWERKGRVTDF